MRLKEFQVKQLCQKVLLTLRTKQLIVLKKPEKDILAKMEEIFLKDLRLEDEIDRQAKALLEQYQSKMGEGLDRQKMFQMVKRQLVKEKNAVVSEGPGVLSEEKMIHIVHLIIDGLYKVDYVDYTDDDAALKEAKRVCVGWVTLMNTAGDAVRARIRSQRNAPLEHSPQWDNLYGKYMEEELKKRGG